MNSLTSAGIFGSVREVAAGSFLILLMLVMFLFF